MCDGFDWDAWGGGVAERIGVSPEAYKEGKLEAEPLGCRVYIGAEGVTWCLVDDDKLGGDLGPGLVAEISRSEVAELEGVPADLVQALGRVKAHFRGATLKEVKRSNK